MPPRTTLPSGPAVKVRNDYRALDATSHDKRAAKTITAIIAALHDEGHQGPLEQGSLATAYTVLMSVNLFMLDTALLSNFYRMAPAATILWSLSAIKVLVSLTMPPNWCCQNPFG